MSYGGKWFLFSMQYVPVPMLGKMCLAAVDQFWNKKIKNKQKNLFTCHLQVSDKENVLLILLLLDQN